MKVKPLKQLITSKPASLTYRASCTDVSTVARTIKTTQNHQAYIPTPQSSLQA